MASVFTKFLLPNAKQVICLDAKINTQRVWDFLGPMFGLENIYHIKNTYIRQTNRQLFRFNSFEALLKQYQQSVLEGKNICVISSSKEKLSEINHFTPLERVTKDGTKISVLKRFYDSSNQSKQFLDDLMDVNTKWCKFQIIGYTPTVSSGVSFEMEHFDEILIYGGPGGCDYLQLIQMVWRVRKISSGQMYCYLDSKTNNLPANLDLVEKALLDSNECHHKDMLRQIG